MSSRPMSAAAALCLAILAAGCDAAGRSPALPTLTPTPTPTPTQPVGAGTLTGMVFELVGDEIKPVEGVQVYCDACGGGHVSSFTETTGAYSFTDVLAGVYPLYVAKQGYALPGSAAPTSGGWMGKIDVRVAGDTRRDIQIVEQ